MKILLTMALLLGVSGYACAYGYGYDRYGDNDDVTYSRSFNGDIRGSDGSTISRSFNGDTIYRDRDGNRTICYETAFGDVRCQRSQY